MRALYRFLSAMGLLLAVMSARPGQAMFAAYPTGFYTMNQYVGVPGMLTPGLSIDYRFAYNGPYPLGQVEAQREIMRQAIYSRGTRQVGLTVGPPIGIDAINNVLTARAMGL